MQATLQQNLFSYKMNQDTHIENDQNLNKCENKKVINNLKQEMHNIRESMNKLIRVKSQQNIKRLNLNRTYVYGCQLQKVEPIQIQKMCESKTRSNQVLQANTNDRNNDKYSEKQNDKQSQRQKIKRLQSQIASLSLKNHQLQTQNKRLTKNLQQSQKQTNTHLQSYKTIQKQKSLLFHKNQQLKYYANKIVELELCNCQLMGDIRNMDQVVLGLREAIQAIKCAKVSQYNGGSNVNSIGIVSDINTKNRQQWDINSNKLNPEQYQQYQSCKTPQQIPLNIINLTKNQQNIQKQLKQLKKIIRRFQKQGILMEKISKQKDQLIHELNQKIVKLELFKFGARKYCQ